MQSSTALAAAERPASFLHGSFTRHEDSIDSLKRHEVPVLDRPRRKGNGAAIRTRPASEIAAEWKSWAPQLLSVLRIVAAAMFIVAGTIKVFGFPIGIPPDGGTSPVMSQAWIGGILEVAGGSLLLVGLFTRPVAFVLSGEMAVAYFQFAAPQSFWPHVNMGMPAVLYCFVWLYYSAAGPGPWSLDALRGKPRAID